MSNIQLSHRRYDLEERTTRFGRSVLIFTKKIHETLISRPLIGQLIRSAASIGANYCEADNAESRKDFKHKISICRKEAKETKYWLSMLSDAIPVPSQETQILVKEATELTLIFNAIVNSVNRNTH